MTVIDTEVIGFRQWRIRVSELFAMMHGVRWTPGKNTAECHARSHLRIGETTRDPCPHPPREGCGCGLYALHSPDDLWYSTVSPGVPAPALIVSGVIVGWGEVLVHNSGWRAEFARIVALGIPTRFPEMVSDLGRDYGVPYVPVRELAGIAGEFGVPVPETLRPPPEPKHHRITLPWGGYIG